MSIASSRRANIKLNSRKTQLSTTSDGDDDDDDDHHNNFQMLLSQDKIVHFLKGAQL